MRQEGIAGLYHGLLPTMLRDVPEIAIQFLMYERLRQARPPSFSNRADQLAVQAPLLLCSISLAHLRLQFEMRTHKSVPPAHQLTNHCAYLSK